MDQSSLPGPPPLAHSGRFEVVIGGCGPVGMTLANLLGIHGVRTLVLERNPGTVEEPRAIAIDAEALRTMQNAGLYDAVAEDMLLGFHVDYVNGRGRGLFSISLSQTPYGHAQQNSFDQPLLERQLLGGLARFPHVEVRFGHAVESFESSADGVVVRGRRVDGEGFAVEGGYLVGCDGGRSAVRQHLGIEMRGHTAPQRWLVVDTRDPHLAETLECRFFCDPARPGMTLRKRHQKRRWEWMLMPGETEEQLLDDGMIQSLLHPHTRVEQVTIERKCVYTFHSIVADRYRVGRVLIAGDAAHMMPPFAGQGMNGGIRDALNLSWKLALVTRGLAGDSLLDTYETERRAHVIAATALANRLGALIQPTSRIRAGLRDLFFWALNLTRAGQRAFDRQLVGTLRAPRMSQGAVLPPGPGTGSVAGQYIVQPKVRRAGGDEVELDSVLGPWFAVVGLNADPTETLPADTRATWERFGARLVHVVPRGTAPSGRSVEDVTGALASWLGSGGEPYAVIRPDKFCAAQFGPSNAAEITNRVLGLLGASPGLPRIQPRSSEDPA